MAIKSKRRLQTNLKLKIFFVFLSLSIALWLLINLSKTYTNEVVFNVEYVNLPAKKVLQKGVIKKVKATVVSTGFSLLRYKIKDKTIILDVSNLAYKKGSIYYYLTNEHLFEIKPQLSIDTKIERIAQDTIFFDLGINASKKIPVLLKADIQFKVGYDFINKIHITPDSIEIIGPETQIDTILNIKTERVELIDVYKDINQSVALQLPLKTTIAISHLKVNIEAQVEKFTEGSLSLPFKVINVPENYIITTFPSRVKVVYRVGLSNFSKITKDDFEIICDYRDVVVNGVDYLVSQLKGRAPLITSFKVTPNKIDFLIEKK